MKFLEKFTLEHFFLLGRLALLALLIFTVYWFGSAVVESLDKLTGVYK